MEKGISEDICIKGSSLVLALKFPPIDNLYSFETLKNAGNVKVEYYVIGTTGDKVDVTGSLQRIDESDADYENAYQFTIQDTSDLHIGVLMIQCTVNVPAHDSIPARTEIARCSTGIAIID